MFNQRFEKCFEVTENVKKLTFQGDWAKLRSKVSFFRQTRTKYLEQNREIQ